MMFFLLFFTAFFSLGFGFQPEVFQLDSNKFHGVHYFEGSGRLLALLEGSLVYSKDHGTTWKESRNIDFQTPMETFMETFMEDPFFTNRAFVTGPNVSYITEDYGESWQKIDIPDSNVSNFSLISFSFTTHPSNRDYIIAIKTGCSNFISPDLEIDYGLPKVHICWCPSAVLLFSKDGGRTFVEIVPPGHDSSHEGFGYFSCDFIKGKGESRQNDDSTFLCKAYNLNYTARVTTDCVLFSVSNMGKRTNKVDQLDGLVVHAIKALESYAVIITREDIQDYDSAKRIWVSDDGINFQEAHFYTRASKFFYNQALKEIDGRIFATLYTQKRGLFEKDGYENYLSDSTGFKFTRLAPLIPKREGWPEFIAIDNLKGTIIQALETDKSLFRKRKIYTKISLDNGKSWSNLRIKDPENKESYSCDVDEDEGCSLNIHGSFFSWNQKDYFNRTLGILTAVGSVSSSRVLDYDKLQTYISRDGGISWSKIFDFSAKVEFGDQGNVMVAVSNNWGRMKDTGTVYYSLDQGYNWSELPFESRMSAYSVSALVNDGSGSVFRIDAYSDSYTYTIDFGKAFDGKTCSESDFEDWYQSNGECVNGARYKFKRRKHDAQCLVKKSFTEIERVEEPCACTKKDYECSPGFSSNKKGECVLDYSLLDASKVCDGSVDTLHLAPTVLTAGNKCWNPLAIDLVEVSCKELGVWKSKHKTRENTFNLETCVSWFGSLLSVWFP